MALPDTVRLTAGTPIVFGEDSGTILGLTVTHTLAVDALAAGAGRMSDSADLDNGSGQLPVLLMVQVAVETGTAPTAGTVVPVYLAFANSTSHFPAAITGTDGAFTVANRNQLGVPASILVAYATGTVTQKQQPSMVLVKGRYLAVVLINDMNQAVRDEATASNNETGVVVTPYFETLTD
jgi:hypothetical protein